VIIYWAVLAAAICTSLVGQLLLKAGTGDGTGSFITQLFRWQTVVGLGCYGGAALLYIIALRKIPMSVALPCTAASYVVIALLGWWFFGESLGAQKMVAIGCIGLGVILLAAA
jgi:multidrug transporter EmrE-like cation transporter